MADEIGLAQDSHGVAQPTAGNDDDAMPAAASLLSRMRRLLERPAVRSL